jgi:hypothetical protein
MGAARSANKIAWQPRMQLTSRTRAEDHQPAHRGVRRPWAVPVIGPLSALPLFEAQTAKTPAGASRSRKFSVLAGTGMDHGEPIANQQAQRACPRAHVVKVARFVRSAVRSAGRRGHVREVDPHTALPSELHPRRCPSESLSVDDSSGIETLSSKQSGSEHAFCEGFQVLITDLVIQPCGRQDDDHCPRLR